MFTLRHELETLFIIFLATGITLLVMVNNAKKTPQHLIVPQLPMALATTPTPTPTTAPQEIIVTTTQISPDGKYNLLLKKQTNATSVTYTVYATPTDTTNLSELYTTTVSPSTVVSLPFNTWAPDDKTVFIKEVTPSAINYYVLPVNGTLTTTPPNITPLFTQRYPNDTLSEVTGWADPQLIVVNVKTSSGAMESFWYDISSQGFIPLANTFY